MTDDTIARLVRLAGARQEVSPDREHRVRRAVLDECRAVARKRRIRKRALIVGLTLAAAAATVLAVRLEWSSSRTPATGAVMATVERLEGSAARVRTGETSASTRLSPADTLRANDTIATGADGRAALRLATGASFRVDRASTARFVSAEVIELVAGGVYVDSGPGSPILELRTTLGVIRKVGTQFEARLESDTLRLRVRSGLVEVHRGTERIPARAGNQVSIRSDGVTTRSVVTYGPEWNWAMSLASTFDIDGRSLGAFLEYLCREQGWVLAYRTPVLAREASGIVLNGSVDGLDAADALEVVLSTSGLSHHLESGVLTILRPTPP